MAEIIDIVDDRDQACIILMNAFGLATDRNPELREQMAASLDPKRERKDAGKVTLEVTVNGISIPLHEALNDALAVFFSKEKDRIKEEAIQMVMGSPLNDLATELQNSEWRIREIMNKHLGEEE